MRLTLNGVQVAFSPIHCPPDKRSADAGTGAEAEAEAGAGADAGAGAEAEAEAEAARQTDTHTQTARPGNRPPARPQSTAELGARSDRALSSSKLVMNSELLRCRQAVRMDPTGLDFPWDEHGPPKDPSAATPSTPPTRRRALPGGQANA